MTSTFDKRVKQFALSESDVRALVGLASIAQPFASNQIILDERSSQKLLLLVDGWALQSKYLSDGRRQVTSMCLPGEILNLEGLFAGQRHEQLSALTTCTVSTLPIEQVRGLIESNSAVRNFMLNQMVIRAATSIEWILSLGQRTARERLAHFLCELHVRLEATGAAKDGVYSFPLTQTDLGDAMGVSSVHINRTFQGFRNEGLVSFPSRRSIFINFAALRNISDFDPAYLGLPALNGKLSQSWL